MKKTVLLSLLSLLILIFKAEASSIESLNFIVSELPVDSSAFTLTHKKKARSLQIPIGQLITVKTKSKQKITGNIVSVNENSIVLVDRKDSTINTSILCVSMNKIRILNSKNKRMGAVAILIASYAVTSTLPFLAALAFAFGGNGVGVTSVVGTVVGIAGFPLAQRMYGKRYKLRKWNVSINEY